MKNTIKTITTAAALVATTATASLAITAGQVEWNTTTGTLPSTCDLTINNASSLVVVPDGNFDAFETDSDTTISVNVKRVSDVFVEAQQMFLEGNTNRSATVGYTAPIASSTIGTMTFDDTSAATGVLSVENLGSTGGSVSVSFGGEITPTQPKIMAEGQTYKSTHTVSCVK